MSYFEACKAALWSLIANPLRSFLTLLGIIIGITSIISVISIIEGLNFYVEDNLGNLGKGVFVINRFGLISNREQYLKAVRRNKRLKNEDFYALRKHVPLAKTIAAETHANATVRYREQSVTGIDIGGITPEILWIEPYTVATGRVITQGEENRAAPVAFLGHEVAAKLFGPLDPLGRQVKIAGKRFKVIGVAGKKGSIMGFSRDTYVKIPLSCHRKLFGARRSLNISVKARNEAALAATRDQCRAILRARHHLDYHDQDDFGIYSAAGINQLWRDLTGILFKVAIFVVSLSLVVGGIVVMNIMLVSVVERTREIGLRKALGATQADIRRQFLVESVMLSCIGGVIGVTLAWLLVQAIALFTPMPAILPLHAPLLAVIICTAIGIFFGLQPAARAAALDPIEALRKVS